MWLFSKKQTLEESGVYKGWTERHCHILPGVDDGVKNMDQALKVLERYESLGITRVWLTPHIMEDFPNTTPELRARYDELRQAYYGCEGGNIDEIGIFYQNQAKAKGKIELMLSAENMMDCILSERLATGDLLPYGDNGDELLVETSYYRPPINFKGMLSDVRSAGYFPVLAHPERYTYMDNDTYDELHQQGVRFQLNLPSLAGAYGQDAAKRAHHLLKKGYYKYQGNDTHSLRSLEHAISAKEISKETAAMILE